jgi:Fur family ferric uptake transcriptional regulator
VEIQAPEFEKWADEIARANGFTDIAHELELFGFCGDH